MGREVRMVPPGWEHPKRADGGYDPLFKGYAKAKEEWDNYKPEEHNGYSRKDWFGTKPLAKNYMPDWSPEEATHLMMYETTSEGTPISPAFATPEKLARWLADNDASAFGRMTATYEEWLDMCNAGWAPSGASINGEFVSGVAAMASRDK